jgi:flagellar assembly protein FliH
VEKLLSHGVATMRSSHRSVFKNIKICGRCFYNCESHTGEAYDQSVEKVKQANLHESGDSSRSDYAFWSEPCSEKPEIPVEEEHSVKLEANLSEYDLAAKKAETERLSKLRRAEKELEEKAEKRLLEAYEQGKARAEDECRLMRESTETKMREADLLLREARQKSKEIVASSEHKVVELAMAVAERLVRTQLEISSEAVTAIVRDTMNMLNGGEQVELYVNPADLNSCQSFSAELKNEFREISRLDVLSDDSIPRGSCRIESESGVAEYLIDEEKAQLKETLLSLARREEEKQAEEDAAYGRH